MNVFELFGTIAIDNSQAERGLDKTVAHAKDAENALEKTFKRIGKYVAAAFSIKAVIDFGKSCTQVYADVAAEAAAFQQVMGDSSDMAQAKLDAVAAKTGVSATRMTGAFTSMTAKFRGLGYDIEDATTLASDGLMIASDASAFWNMSLDDAMSHLNSFINGSYEGGEAIGLFANDTQMAAYAVEKGIVADAKAWAQLDEATKQATRLDYAKTMQQNSGVTGQAAKEAGAYQNVLGNLTDAWRQFQAVVGKPILERFVLPVMRKLTEMMPGLTEAVQKGIDWLTEGFDKIAAYFSEVFTEDGMDMKAFPNALRNMFRDAARSIPALLSSVGRSIRNAWVNTVWPGVQGVFKAVFGIELPNWNTVTKQISDGWNNVVWPGIQNFFSTLFGVELPNWPTLKQKISDGWDTIKQTVAKFFENPFVVTLPKWEELKADIENGWKNIVLPALSGLFEKTFEVKPEDATGEEVGKKLREWWDKVVAFLGGIFGAVFGVNTDDETGATTGKKIKTWWEKVLAFIGNVFAVVFNVNTDDDTGATTGTKIKNWWETVVKFIGNIFRGFFKVDPDNPTDTANKIITWFEGVLTSVGDIFFAFFGLKTSDTDSDGTTYADKLKNWFTTLLETIGDFFFAVFQLDTPEGASAIEKIRGWWGGLRASAESVLEWTLALFGVPKAKADGVKNLVSSWWNGVKTAAQDALIWALKLFTNPEETAGQVATQISTWWAGVVASAQSVLNWWLKLFENPREAGADVKKSVEDWWTGVKADAESALIWTLKLFGVPLADGEGVKNLVSGWWQGVKGKAQEALSWTLKLFENPEETAGQVGTFISTWWATVVNSAIGACKWVLNLFGIPVENADDVKSHIAKWWEGVKSGAESALVWTLTLFGVPKAKAEGVKNLVSSWWQGVKTAAQDALTWTLQLFGIPKEDGGDVGTLISTWWAKVVNSVIGACKWVLGMGDMPKADGENGVIATITKWWEGVSKSLESVLAIDLSGIDVAGIFTAANTAIQGVIESAKTFAGDVAKSIAFDVNGRVQLGATLSNLFDAGVKAIENLLTNAGSLVGNIVAAVTGDEEAGKKIGGVFTDLFSWASEVIVGVKDGAITAFQWLVDNKDMVISAIGGVAGAMAMFALANPAIAVVTALVTLIGTMSTDWKNFEANHPKLVSMFQELTGLNFTTVASSLDAFKTNLNELIAYFTANESRFSSLLNLAGALAFISGHPIAGVALLTAGGAISQKIVKTRAEDIFEQEMYKNMAYYAAGLDLGTDEAFLGHAKGKLQNANIPGSGNLRKLFVDLIHGKNGGGVHVTESGNTKGGGSSRWGDDEETPTPFVDYLPPPDKTQRENNNVQPGTGIPGDAHTVTYDPKNYVPGSFGMQSLVQTMQNMILQNNTTMMASVQEGVIAGLSGVTINVDVNTGDVVLSDRTIVGKITPKINAALGALAQRSGRTKG